MASVDEIQEPRSPEEWEPRIYDTRGRKTEAEHNLRATFVNHLHNKGFIRAAEERPLEEWVDLATERNDSFSLIRAASESDWQHRFHCGLGTPSQKSALRYLAEGFARVHDDHSCLAALHTIETVSSDQERFSIPDRIEVIQGLLYLARHDQRGDYPLELGRAIRDELVKDLTEEYDYARSFTAMKIATEVFESSEAPEDLEYLLSLMEKLIEEQDQRFRDHPTGVDHMRAGTLVDWWVEIYKAGYEPASSKAKNIIENSERLLDAVGGLEKLNAAGDPTAWDEAFDLTLNAPNDTARELAFGDLARAAFATPGKSLDEQKKRAWAAAMQMNSDRRSELLTSSLAIQIRAS